MDIYLDNSATTRPCREATEAVKLAMEEVYGNPSSMHIKGFDAEKLVKGSKDTIASTLKCDPKELVFTSGGTESNNLALIGGARARRRSGLHIITTSVEHPSVLETVAYLEEEGFRVTRLPVDQYGRVTAGQVREALTDDTIIVSCMMVNNELGTREPVEEIGSMLKKERQDVLFHVDAVQGYGKYMIRPKECGIDLLSVSGHKIHGPKGIGFLYVRNGVILRPIIFGGGQQKGLRSGTENVPGIAGLAAAVKHTYSDFEAGIERMYSLKSRLEEGLAAVEGAVVNSIPGKGGAPHIVNVSFEGIRSEVLLHALEDKGVYVSSGSACASNHPGLSHVLLAAGIPKQRIEGTLRFSLDTETTREEIDAALAAVAEAVPFYRRLRRR